MATIYGIDPSFTGTGLAIIHTGLRRIEVLQLSEEIGGSSFKNVCRAADSLVTRVASYMTGPDRVVISEEPIPSSSYSAGLFALDAKLFERVKPRYSTHPSYLAHIHGRRKTTKTDSVNLAKRLLQVFKEEGWSIPEKRFSHNCAEAFLIALLAFKVENVDVVLNDRLRVEIPNIETAKYTDWRI